MSTRMVWTFARTLLIVFMAYTSIFSRDKTTLDEIAEQWVKVSLKVGLFQPDFIDAYYGPPEWRPTASPSELKNPPYAELKAEVVSLLERLNKVAVGNIGSGGPLRRHHLQKHLTSLQSYLDILSGAKVTFDQESQAIYDIVLPAVDLATYERILQRLDRILPGTGDVSPRLVDFEKRFAVPRDKLDTLMKAALSECRTRTKRYLSLPEGESVVFEYVANQPWWAYNWFKGNGKSVIQIDSSRDIKIGNILGLAAHEGYPGHHVAGILSEQQLYLDSGWSEYSVFPLYAPSSILWEGMANCALDLAFPRTERRAFYALTIFPLAGFDTSYLAQYLEVLELRDSLWDADAQLARKYLDGTISRDETISLLQRYGGRILSEAEGTIEFFDRYRAYSITYVVGEDLIRRFVEHNRLSSDSTEARWARFSQIIMGNLTPSDLIDSISNK